jgi:hypothetical protein
MVTSWRYEAILAERHQRRSKDVPLVPVPTNRHLKASQTEPYYDFVRNRFVVSFRTHVVLQYIYVTEMEGVMTQEVRLVDRFAINNERFGS